MTLKGESRYWNLKQEALDRNLWTNCFGRRYGPVARSTKLMHEYSANWIYDFTIKINTWISLLKEYDMQFVRDSTRRNVAVRLDWVRSITHDSLNKNFWISFMFCWPCISIHPCNESQLDALFIFSLFRQSTATYFGHICSPSSGGILCIYNNWYVLCFFSWLSVVLDNR